MWLHVVCEHVTFFAAVDSSANEVIRKVFPDKVVKRDRFAIPADA